MHCCSASLTFSTDLLIAILDCYHQDHWSASNTMYPSLHHCDITNHLDHHLLHLLPNSLTYFAEWPGFETSETNWAVVSVWDQHVVVVLRQHFDPIPWWSWLFFSEHQLHSCYSYYCWCASDSYSYFSAQSYSFDCSCCCLSAEVEIHTSKCGQWWLRRPLNLMVGAIHYFLPFVFWKCQPLLAIVCSIGLDECYC